MEKLNLNEVFKFMQEFEVNFINRYGDMIIDLRTNTYTTILGCYNIEDVITRVVMALCRPIGKGLEVKEANRLLEKVNRYFRTSLTRDDMRLMYTELCYMSKFEYFKDFIKRGFPMQELKEGEKL